MRKLISCIAGALLLLSVEAFAQAPASPNVYAVLSLVGDQLGIVVAQQDDRGFAPYRRDALIVENSIFDDVTVGAAANAIRKVIPNAELAALNTRSSVLFDKQRALFEEKGTTISVPEAIRTALQKQKATHLLLITKHRDDISLQFGQGRQDRDTSGKLEGLGFYFDDTVTANSGVKGQEGRSFIAPYAYLRVALIDAKTLNVVGKQTIVASAVIPPRFTMQQETAGQWSSMASADKVRSVESLLQREFGRVIPLLLKTG